MNSLTPDISTATYLLILFLSIVCSALLSINTEVRDYWRSAFNNSRLALMLTITMIAPFLGGGRGFGGDEGPSIVRGVRFVVIIAIFLISINWLLRLGKLRTPIGTPTRWMIVYALICIASATYSVDPIITTWKGFEVLSLVLASIYICGRINKWEDVQEILNILCLFILFFCVTTLVGAIISPSAALLSQTSGFSLRGLAPAINSNSVSQWGILLATITLARALSKNYTGATTSLWFLFSLGMLVAILGHSRTALFAGAVAMVVILLYGRHYKTAGFAIFSTMLVMMVGSLVDSLSTYVTRGQDAELFLSMSNRTYFWNLAIEAWSERPILGYGFYSGQRVILGWATVDNAYLEIAVGTGIVGLMAFAAAPISAAVILLKSVPRKAAQAEYMVIWLQLMSIFTIILLRSFTSTSFSGLHPNTILFVITTILIASMHRFLRNNALDGSQIDIKPKAKSTEKLRYIKKKPELQYIKKKR